MVDETTQYEKDAYARGVDAAKAAASWIVDGNTKREAIPAVLEMMDNGDPAADDYLPATPNLSGEWADDPTPMSLARDILGDDCPLCGNAGTYIGDAGYVECECSDNDVSPVDHAPAVVEAIADAFELGVSETFMAECERILRAAVV